MPRRFTGKLFLFLFRHLELGTFGERLRWLDRESGIFQLLWKHGNGSSITPMEDFAVFQAWHELKVRKKPCDVTEAKQRFRAATAKMRLEKVKNWQGVGPEKNYQYRRFPKDDLEYLFKHVDLDREFPEPKNRRIRLVPPSTDAPDSSPRLSPPTRPVLKTKSKKKPRPPDRNRRLMPKDVVVKIEPPDDPNDASGDMPDEFTKYQVMDCIPNVLHYSPSSQQRRAMVFKQERDWY